MSGGAGGRRTVVSDRALLWCGAAVVIDLGLVASLFVPWRTLDVDAPALPAGRPVPALGTAATGRAVDAVHRTLVLQSLAWAALELLVLAAALVGAFLVVRRTIGRARPLRDRAARGLALGAVACAAAACWVVPAFGSSGSLTVHLVATAAPGAYLGFALAVTAGAATVAATEPALRRAMLGA